MGAVERMIAMGRPMLFAAAFFAAPATAQEMKLKPVDQAGRDPAFAEFRAALLDAVRRRDADYVVAQASADIKLSFGGDFGQEAFRELLTGTEEWQGEDYWSELQRALELGGVFLDRRSFCTPYVSCLDVPGCPDCDPYETIFTLSDSATAHAAPDRESRVIAELSYDVLKIDPEVESGSDWTPVILPGGRRGYVYGPDFRMSIDYRALFEKIAEGWRMTVFIAGD